MGENGDTNADSCREQSSDCAAETCVVCGDPIDTEEWHPIETEWDEDGELSIHAFCSQDCRDVWSDS